MCVHNCGATVQRDTTQNSSVPLILETVITAQLLSLSVLLPFQVYKSQGKPSLLFFACQIVLCHNIKSIYKGKTPIISNCYYNKPCRSITPVIQCARNVGNSRMYHDMSKILPTQRMKDYCGGPAGQVYTMNCAASLVVQSSLA